MRYAAAVPAPTAPLLGFALGVVFAWLAADELARAHASPFATRSLAVVALFGLLVFAPAAAYFLVFQEDWAWAYLVDRRRMPSAVELALVLLDAAAPALGFLAATSRARARRLVPLLGLAALALAPAFAFVLVALPRLTVDATYTQFHLDFGRHPVAGGPLGWALLGVDAVVVAGVAWTVRQLRALSRARA